MIGAARAIWSALKAGAIPTLPSLPAAEENTARVNYTTPSNINGVRVSLIGGGGGGGSGADNGGADGGTMTGGGGGGGGSHIRKAYISKNLIGSTFTVTVGSGGAGAPTSVGQNGNPGVAGGASSFISGSVNLTAGGGQPGQGGSKSGTVGAGGNGGSATSTGMTPQDIIQGTAGGNASDGVANPAKDGVDNTNKRGGGAGGGGGGSRGWLGGRYMAGRGGRTVYSNIGGSPGPLDTTTAGTTPSSVSPFPGAGGGGGGPKTGTYGGVGGAGGSRGGGGGGGAGGNTATAGGAGGAGYTRVEWLPNATVFVLAGTGGDPAVMPTWMRGDVCNGQNVVLVYYPNQKADIDNDIQAGAATLNDKLNSTAGKKIVFAHSLGAVVSSCWLKTYGPTSSIPAGDLEFILMGNSVRKYNGYYPLNSNIQFDSGHAGQPFVSSSLVSPISTAYTVTDFALQGDLYADWPTEAGGGGLSTLQNAMRTGGDLGFAYLTHLSYNNYPMERWDYRYYTEGNITYVLMPNDGFDQSKEQYYNRVEGSPRTKTIRNMATNPGFEGPDDGGFTGRWGTGGAGTSAKTSGGGKSGSYYRLMPWSTASTNPDGAGFWYYDIEAVTVGKQYTCSVWVNPSETHKFRPQVSFFSDNNATGAVTGTATGSYADATGNTWTRYSITTGAAPSGTVSMRLELYAASTANGGTNFTTSSTMKVDEVLITEGTTLYDYFDGTTNGGAWVGTQYNSASTKVVPYYS